MLGDVNGWSTSWLGGALPRVANDVFSRDVLVGPTGAVGRHVEDAIVPAARP